MNIIESIIVRDSLENATSYGSLEKARTLIVQLHSESTETVTHTWTPQTEAGYVGLDPPLM